ncbi:Adenine phosphoribosyltransferase [Trichinella pseudospiralis]
MKIPFIPIRKHGKLPGKLITINYEKEYGLDIFEMQEDNILQKDANVLLFDDILATVCRNFMYCRGCCEIDREKRRHGKLCHFFG